MQKEVETLASENMHSSIMKHNLFATLCGWYNNYSVLAYSVNLLSRLLIEY